MKLLIKNIRTLVQVEPEDVSPQARFVAGSDMKKLPCLHDAWLAVEDGRIAAYGTMHDWPGISDWSGLEIIDANDGLVLPAWCDSHTHLVFAGTREDEFVDRINGLSYEDIFQRGGGILNSAKRLRDASEEELIAGAEQRLEEIMRMGTGAVEIKSGYGLSVESELKMLRVIKKLKERSPLTIKATFLGAHAVPAELKDNKAGYIDLLINELMPRIAEEQLAEYCDVFCERNYFTEDETLRILEAGKRHGMKPRVHAEQLSHSGGIRAGVRSGAASVDHLEYISDEDITLLTASNTMPTLLPAAAFFLSLPNPPARKMIDAGLPVAAATDFNPGSSPTGNMNLIISLLCVTHKLTPEEAINAATINSAYAMDVSHELGSIAVGKKANLFITRPVKSYNYLPYVMGQNLVDTIILNGKVQ